MSAAAVAQAETPALLQVIYGRQLAATVVTAAGVTQNISFTVVGPGAKQKVYLPPTGSVNAAGVLQADVTGVQGGWRSVSPAVNAATGEQIMVDILDVETVKKLYLALDKEVTMNSVPINIKDRVIVSSTLAYWENSPGSSQGELIPTYEFDVTYTEVDTNQPGQDFFYVPASQRYLRPVARILDAPTAVDQGIQVTLTAADATQTLKALGLGDDFDFVAGYNGAGGTYTYEWYLGSVAPENKITDLNPNDGATKVTLQAPGTADEQNATFEVYLVVKDTDSPNESTATAVAQIQVNPAIFLPAITGNR